jgi:hypothetical protein
VSEVIKPTDRLWVRRSEHWENYYFYCLGCKELHGFRTKAPPGDGATKIPLWTFDGNVEQPSFTPSLRYLRHKGDYPGCRPHCRTIVTAGKIQFCSDCEHELAGKTLDMPRIEEHLPTDYMIA